MIESGMFKKSNHHHLVLALLLFAGAYLGFDRLMARPFHFDEGVNGYWVQEIWKNGFFKYDPTNFHGPLYFYILQLSEIFFSFQWPAHRAVTVLFSLLNLFGIYSLGRFLSAQLEPPRPSEEQSHIQDQGVRVQSRNGWRLNIAVISSLFWLASPVALYYARYSIHETVLLSGEIFFTLGLLKFLSSPSRSSGAMMVWSSVLMSATKETFVIFIFALMVSFLFLRSQFSDRHFLFVRKHRSDLLGQLSLGLSVWALLFSGFGRNLDGVLDFFRAFLLWFHVGTQDPAHVKPAYYFVQLIWENEPLVIFAFVLSLLGWVYRDRYILFFSALGLIQFFVYSLIGYKTPWCLLGLTWPWALVSGLVLSRYLQQGSLRWRTVGWAVCVLWLGVCSFSIWRARSLALFSVGSESNSYVYVQSSRELQSVVNLISWMQTQPKKYKVQCPQEASELWPLPWILSRLDGTTCFSQDIDPQNDLIFFQEDEPRARDVQKELETSWSKHFELVGVPLRDGVRPLQMLMAAELAEAFKTEIQSKSSLEKNSGSRQ